MHSEEVRIVAMNWKHKLQARSRDPQFLWKIVLGILAIGLLIGLAVESTLTDTVKYEEVWERISERVEKLEAGAKANEWWRVWWDVPEIIWLRLGYTGPLVLALATGVCWLTFVLQALKVQGWNDPKLWLALAGLLFGVLSIWPTFYFIYWQEYGWGLRDSDSLIAGLRYNILGIGLREEFAKLVCVLPLMPFLLRLRSELAALLITACVGLGFAVEENIGKFFSQSGTSVVGRYITANPFHMVLTGLLGLALYRGLRSPREWGPHALATFVIVVFAHGLYDAFILVPALQEYSLGGMIVFALIVYQFFRELRDLRPRGGDTISLSANFLCGVSLVVAVTLVYLCAVSDRDTALTALGVDLLSVGVMVYLFLREMPESMIDV